ncbi:MAG: hypothetical protein JST05_10800 [Acidobacteria bacterium]|nr:hypothetical protein [Acidobacteriota bacterium]
MAKDANGVPLGLDTNPADLQTLPARGVAVGVYTFDTTRSQWFEKTKGYTDSNGHYSLKVPSGSTYVVELESSFSSSSSLGSSSANLLADPDGLSSLLPISQRVQYLLRKAPDGTAATASSPLPVSLVNQGATYTVDFAVDLSTQWLTGVLDEGLGNSAPNFQNASFETGTTGSRPLAILDDLYEFSTTFGDPTFNGLLDLHYKQGHSETQGTYIEFDRLHWVHNAVDLAYDNKRGAERFLGSIQGGPSNDDAWDESVIFRMLGRSLIQGRMGVGPYVGTPFQLLPVQAPLDGLTPDLAMVEGLPSALAANLLKSPYLADTDGTSALIGAPTLVSDISSVPAGDVGPYSARTIAALAWEITLKANGITSPGTTTEWANINPKAVSRLFLITTPTSTTTTGSVTTTTNLFSPPNIYMQLRQLQKAKSSTEPVDLAGIFTDSVINTIAAPFNLPWPQPSTTSFGQSWTSTVSGTLGPTYEYDGTLSMSSDTVQVNGVYPNASYKEMVFLGVSQTTDQSYQLMITPTGGYPANATIRVTVFAGTDTQAFDFNSGASGPYLITLPGNGSLTSPNRFPIMIRLLSPSTSQPDIPFTLTLTPPANGTLRGTGPLR